MDKKEKLTKLIRKLEKKNTDDIKYIYRGTNAEYSKAIDDNSNKHEGVCSNLFRWAKENSAEFEDKLLPQDIEADQVEMTRRHFPTSTSNLEILTEIQHYGGKTNLIDFSRNLYVALFFACYEKIVNNDEVDGEIILFKEKESITEINYDILSQEDQVLNPPITQNSKGRVNIQSSVFVYPAKGYLDIGKNEHITIKKDLKIFIINWLDEFHNISHDTIFNDLLGFIQDENNLRTSTIELYISYTKQKQGDHEGEIEALDKVIKLSPNYFIAYNNRGLAKTNLNKFADAIDDYDKAIAINPNYSGAYNNRGNTKTNLNKLKDAIDDYDKAIAINPNYSGAYNNRGLAKLKLEKYDEAFKDYDKAIAINPNFSEAYNNRGTNKANLNKFADAIDDYDKAIANNPNDYGAYYNRGLAKYELKKYNEAIKDFDEAIANNPNDYGAYYNRGLAKYELKKYNEAIKDFDEVIKIDPKFALAYYFRGKYKARSDDKEGAKADFKIAKDFGCKLPIPPEFSD